MLMTLLILLFLKSFGYLSIPQYKLRNMLKNINYSEHEDLITTYKTVSNIDLTVYLDYVHIYKLFFLYHRILYIMFLNES